MKALMSLPAPALRALCGGGVAYRGGRTLDPRLQFLAHAAQGRRALWLMPPAEARTALAEAVALTGLSVEPSVTQEAASVEGPGGAIPVTLLRPDKPDPACPPLLFLQGGGGVMATGTTALGFASRLARLARTTVALADYRLAPEHKAPAALEDALAVFRWLRDHGSKTGEVAIGGESSGGGLAAAVCQALRREDELQPKLQLLIYPLLDLTAEGGSMSLYADAFPAPRALTDWAIGHALPSDAHPADPTFSPGREPDLAGLAPAVVVSAGFDPLLDQDEDYARRLAAAGVPVVYRCYENLSHGFLSLAGVVPTAKAAALAIGELTREALSGVRPEPPLERL
jgi:acetyl esterase/lipase